MMLKTITFVRGKIGLRAKAHVWAVFIAPALRGCVKMELKFFAVRFIGRIQDKLSISGFSPTHSFIGLKPNIVIHSLNRWMNPTAKDNFIFTQPVMAGVKNITDKNYHKIRN